MSVTRWVALAAAMVGLAGCGLFGSDDPEPELTAADRAAEIRSENVQAVQRLEIGVSRAGFVLAAFGTAPGLGYSKPRLVARRGGAPAEDGMLDYDFVVDAPPAGVSFPPGTPKAREVRADAEIAVETARRVRGVRVHASAGGVQMFF